MSLLATVIVLGIANHTILTGCRVAISLDALSLGASMVQRYLLSWVAVRFDASALDYLTRRLLALPMK